MKSYCWDEDLNGKAAEAEETENEDVAVAVDDDVKMEAVEKESRRQGKGSQRVEATAAAVKALDHRTDYSPVSYSAAISTTSYCDDDGDAFSPLSTENAVVVRSVTLMYSTSVHCLDQQSMIYYSHYSAVLSVVVVVVVV